MVKFGRRVCFCSIIDVLEVLGRMKMFVNFVKFG